MATDLGRSTNIKIGLTVNTVEDVKIEPHVEFIPGIIERITCGGEKLISLPRCRWTYPDRLLSGEQFHQLKSLVGDAASVSVYVDVPTQELSPITYEPDIITYQGIMHWPQEGVMMVNMNRWQIPDEGILFDQLESA